MGRPQGVGGLLRGGVLQSGRSGESGWFTVSPMMDRSKDSAATGQTFFLDKLVRPLLDPFCTFLHAENSSMKTVLKSNLISNRDKWAELVEKHGRLKAKDLCEISRLEGPTSSEEA